MPQRSMHVTRPPPSHTHGHVVGAQVRATDSLISLSESLRASGKLEEAAAMQTRALSLCEDVLGVAHEQSLRARLRLAELHEEAGKLDEALLTLERWQEHAAADAAEAAEAAETIERLRRRRSGSPENSA